MFFQSLSHLSTESPKFEIKGFILPPKKSIIIEVSKEARDEIAGDAQIQAVHHVIEARLKMPPRD